MLFLKYTIAALTLENFKGIEKLKIDFDKNINVIIGENGSGKSSILYALALVLSQFIGRFNSLEENGLLMTDDMIFSKADKTSVDIKLNVEFGPDAELKDDYKGPKRTSLAWNISKTRGSDMQMVSKQQLLQDIAKRIKTTLSKIDVLSIPIAVYYSTNRSALDIPLEPINEDLFNKMTAFEGAFNKKNYNDFWHFFEWYRNREDLENEELRERGGNYRDSQLEAVRKAIESMLPGFSGLKVKRGKPARMLVNKQVADKAIELDITQLSDGEKCMLAMVGDIARRLAVAYPDMSKPLEGAGIILIDEIDLHLHPQWENVIMERLRGIFPKCQFIVTTHSPLIIGSLPSSQIFQLSLNPEGKVQIDHPDYSKGLTANETISLLMGAPYQDEAIKERFDELYKAIEDGDWANADKVVKRLREDMPVKTPELTKAEAYLALSRDDK